MSNFQESSKKDFDKSLENYFYEINKIPLLNSEEEILLAKKIKEGDKRALSKLVLSNLRFVVSVAKEYRCSGLQFGDLVNEGNLGLIEAANRYDETKGFRFITYAVWWVKQSILQSITNHTRVVRLPANQQNNLKKLTKTKEALEQKFNRAPTLQEVASSLDISENEINDIYQFENKSISLNSPLNNTSRNSLLDTMKDDNHSDLDKKLVKESFLYDIYNVFKSLTSREAEIVCMYYGIFIEKPLNLEEISKKYKLTRERVRQIKETALVRLRQMKKSSTLREYLQ